MTLIEATGRDSSGLNSVLQHVRWKSIPGTIYQEHKYRRGLPLIDNAILVEVELLEDTVGHVDELLGQVELSHHLPNVLLFLSGASTNVFVNNQKSQKDSKKKT